MNLIPHYQKISNVGCVNNMPFKSKKQEKYMWAKHPEIARKWEDKYGTFKKRKVKHKK